MKRPPSGAEAQFERAVYRAMKIYRQGDKPIFSHPEFQAAEDEVNEAALAKDMKRFRMAIFEWERTVANLIVRLRRARAARG